MTHEGSSFRAHRSHTRKSGGSWNPILRRPGQSHAHTHQSQNTDKIHAATRPNTSHIKTSHTTRLHSPNKWHDHHAKHNVLSRNIHPPRRDPVARQQYPTRLQWRDPGSRSHLRIQQQVRDHNKPLRLGRLDEFQPQQVLTHLLS